MSFREQIEKDFNALITRLEAHDRESRRWGDNQKRNVWLQHTKFKAVLQDARNLIVFVQMLKDENKALAREVERLSITNPDGQILETATVEQVVERR